MPVDYTRYTDTALNLALSRLEVRIANARHADDLENLNRVHNAIISEQVRRDRLAGKRQEGGICG